MGDKMPDVKVPYDVFIDVFKLIGIYVPSDAPEAKNALEWFSDKVGKRADRKEYVKNLDKRN